MRRPWTEREIALLRAAATDNRRDGMIKNTGPGRLLALAAELDRTYTAVLCKASKLGIRSGPCERGLWHEREPDRKREIGRAHYRRHPDGFRARREANLDKQRVWSLASYHRKRRERAGLVGPRGLRSSRSHGTARAATRTDPDPTTH